LAKKWLLEHWRTLLVLAMRAKAAERARKKKEGNGGAFGHVQQWLYLTRSSNDLRKKKTANSGLRRSVMAGVGSNV
jgi:hypothetical protein